MAVSRVSRQVTGSVADVGSRLSEAARFHDQVRSSGEMTSRTQEQKQGRPISSSDSTTNMNPHLFVPTTDGGTDVHAQNERSEENEAASILEEVREGKSIEQVAEERDMTRDEVIEQLEAAGYEVETSETGPIGSEIRETTIADPETGETITEYYKYDGTHDIVVDGEPEEYVIQEGDTLWDIAEAYGVTLDELKATNPELFDDAHDGGDLIHPGETVVIGDGAGAAGEDAADAELDGLLTEYNEFQSEWAEEHGATVGADGAMYVPNDAVGQEWEEENQAWWDERSDQAEAAHTSYTQAVFFELRQAAVEARSRGEDPNQAVSDQAEEIRERDTSGHWQDQITADAIDAVEQQVLGESQEVRQAHVEYGTALEQAAAGLEDGEGLSDEHRKDMEDLASTLAEALGVEVPTYFVNPGVGPVITWSDEELTAFVLENLGGLDWAERNTVAEALGVEAGELESVLEAKTALGQAFDQQASDLERSVLEELAGIFGVTTPNAGPYQPQAFADLSDEELRALVQRELDKLQDPDSIGGVLDTLDEENQDKLAAVLGIEPDELDTILRDPEQLAEALGVEDEQVATESLADAFILMAAGDISDAHGNNSYINTLLFGDGYTAGVVDQIAVDLQAGELGRIIEEIDPDELSGVEKELWEADDQASVALLRRLEVSFGVGEEILPEGGGRRENTYAVIDGETIWLTQHEKRLAEIDPVALALLMKSGFRIEGTDDLGKEGVDDGGSFTITLNKQDYDTSALAQDGSLTSEEISALITQAQEDEASLAALAGLLFRSNPKELSDSDLSWVAAHDTFIAASIREQMLATNDGRERWHLYDENRGAMLISSGLLWQETNDLLIGQVGDWNDIIAGVVNDEANVYDLGGALANTLKGYSGVTGVAELDDLSSTSPEHAATILKAIIDNVDLNKLDDADEFYEQLNGLVAKADSEEVAEQVAEWWTAPLEQREGGSPGHLWNPETGYEFLPTTLENTAQYGAVWNETEFVSPLAQNIAGILDEVSGDTSFSASYEDAMSAYTDAMENAPPPPSAALQSYEDFMSRRDELVPNYFDRIMENNPDLGEAQKVVYGEELRDLIAAGMNLDWRNNDVDKTTVDFIMEQMFIEAGIDEENREDTPITVTVIPYVYAAERDGWTTGALFDVDGPDKDTERTVYTGTVSSYTVTETDAFVIDGGVMANLASQAAFNDVDVDTITKEQPWLFDSVKHFQDKNYLDEEGVLYLPYELGEQYGLEMDLFAPSAGRDIRVGTTAAAIETTTEKWMKGLEIGLTVASFATMLVPVGGPLLSGALRGIGAAMRMAGFSRHAVGAGLWATNVTKGAHWFTKTSPKRLPGNVSPQWATFGGLTSISVVDGLYRVREMKALGMDTGWSNRMARQTYLGMIADGAGAVGMVGGLFMPRLLARTGPGVVSTGARGVHGTTQTFNAIELGIGGYLAQDGLRHLIQAGGEASTFEWMMTAMGGAMLVMGGVGLRQESAHYNAHRNQSPKDYILATVENTADYLGKNGEQDGDAARWLQAAGAQFPKLAEERAEHLWRQSDRTRPKEAFLPEALDEVYSVLLNQRIAAIWQGRGEAGEDAHSIRTEAAADLFWCLSGGQARYDWEQAGEPKDKKPETFLPDAASKIYQLSVEQLAGPGASDELVSQATSTFHRALLERHANHHRKKEDTPDEGQDHFLVEAITDLFPQLTALRASHIRKRAGATNDGPEVFYDRAANEVYGTSVELLAGAGASDELISNAAIEFYQTFVQRQANNRKEEEALDRDPGRFLAEATRNLFPLFKSLRANHIRERAGATDDGAEAFHSKAGEELLNATIEQRAQYIEALDGQKRSRKEYRDEAEREIGIILGLRLTHGTSDTVAEDDTHAPTSQPQESETPLIPTSTDWDTVRVQDPRTGQIVEAWAGPEVLRQIEPLTTAFGFASAGHIVAPGRPMEGMSESSKSPRFFLIKDTANGRHQLLALQSGDQLSRTRNEPVVNTSGFDDAEHLVSAQQRPGSLPVLSSQQNQQAALTNLHAPGPRHFLGPHSAQPQTPLPDSMQPVEPNDEKGHDGYTGQQDNGGHEAGDEAAIDLKAAFTAWAKKPIWAGTAGELTRAELVLAARRMIADGGSEPSGQAAYSGVWSSEEIARYRDQVLQESFGHPEKIQGNIPTPPRKLQDIQIIWENWDDKVIEIEKELRSQGIEVELYDRATGKALVDGLTLFNEHTRTAIVSYVKGNPLPSDADRTSVTPADPEILIHEAEHGAGGANFRLATTALRPSWEDLKPAHASERFDNLYEAVVDWRARRKAKRLRELHPEWFKDADGNSKPLTDSPYNVEAVERLLKKIATAQYRNSPGARAKAEELLDKAFHDDEEALITVRDIATKTMDAVDGAVTQAAPRTGEGGGLPRERRLDGRRRGDLNYLGEGSVTVDGETVNAKALEVDVPEDAFLVIADAKDFDPATTDLDAPLTVERLVDDIRSRENENYAPGQDIVLYICGAGTRKRVEDTGPLSVNNYTSITREVSNRLGSRVYAIDGEIEIGATTTVPEGSTVKELPNLPLTDISGGKNHPQAPDHEAQEAQRRFWLDEGDRRPPVADPFNKAALKKGAQVDGKPIDPRTLGRAGEEDGQPPRLTKKRLKHIKGLSRNEITFLTEKNLSQQDERVLAKILSKYPKDFFEILTHSELGQLPDYSYNQLKRYLNKLWIWENQPAQTGGKLAGKPALSEGQLAGKPLGVVRALSIRPLAEIDPALLGQHLTSEDLAGMTPEQFGVLTVEQQSALSEQLGRLPAETWTKFKEFDATQHTEEPAALSPEQRTRWDNLHSLLIETLGMDKVREGAIAVIHVDSAQEFERHFGSPHRCLVQICGKTSLHAGSQRTAMNIYEPRWRIEGKSLIKAQERKLGAYLSPERHEEESRSPRGWALGDPIILNLHNVDGQELALAQGLADAARVEVFLPRTDESSRWRVVEPSPESRDDRSGSISMLPEYLPGHRDPLQTFHLTTQDGETKKISLDSHLGRAIHSDNRSITFEFFDKILKVSLGDLWNVRHINEMYHLIPPRHRRYFQLFYGGTFLFHDYKYLSNNSDSILLEGIRNTNSYNKNSIDDLYAIYNIFQELSNIDVRKSSFETYAQFIDGLFVTNKDGNTSIAAPEKLFVCDDGDRRILSAIEDKIAQVVAALKQKSAELTDLPYAANQEQLAISPKRSAGDAPPPQSESNGAPMGSRRRGDLNYLGEGSVTVDGQTVDAQALEIDVSPDAFLIIADHNHQPSVERIIEDVRNSENYTPGQDVVLYFCEAGMRTHKTEGDYASYSTSLAREISNRLGSRVHAFEGEIILGEKTTIERKKSTVRELPNLPLFEAIKKGGDTHYHAQGDETTQEAQRHFWLDEGGRRPPVADPFNKAALKKGARVEGEDGKLHPVDPRPLGTPREADDRGSGLQPSPSQDVERLWFYNDGDFNLFVSEMVNGPVANELRKIGLEPNVFAYKLRALFSMSPTLKRLWRQAVQRHGVEIMLPGHATQYLAETNQITLKLDDVGSPLEFIRALAHELSHAVSSNCRPINLALPGSIFNPAPGRLLPLFRLNEQGRPDVEGAIAHVVDARLQEEARAVLDHSAVLDELTRAGQDGADSIDPLYFPIYKQYRDGMLSESEAIEQLSKLIGNAAPSGSPNETFRSLYGKEVKYLWGVEEGNGELPGALLVPPETQGGESEHHNEPIRDSSEPPSISEEIAADRLADLQFQRALIDHIRTQNGITFAEFMELSHYGLDGEGGYYSSGTVSIGNALGDQFQTAPELSEFFGRTVARALVKMYRQMGSPKTFDIVEMGAGNGTLAHDILEKLRADHPDLNRALRYIIVEVSKPLIERQREKLAGHKNVHWIQARADFPPLGGIRGVFLENELADDLPVHRAVVHRGEIREIYVTVDEHGRFFEEERPPSPSLMAVLPDLEGLLPQPLSDMRDGQQLTINARAIHRIRQLGAALHEGYVLIFDYGGPGATFQKPYTFDRGRGPIERAYELPGKINITAYVDSQILSEIGQEAGLIPATSIGAKRIYTQKQFLEDNGFQPEFLNSRPSIDEQGKALAVLNNFGGFFALALEKRGGTNGTSSSNNGSQSQSANDVRPPKSLTLDELAALTPEEVDALTHEELLSLSMEQLQTLLPEKSDKLKRVLVADPERGGKLVVALINKNLPFLQNPERLPDPRIIGAKHIRPPDKPSLQENWKKGPWLDLHHNSDGTYMLMPVMGGGAPTPAESLAAKGFNLQDLKTDQPEQFANLLNSPEDMAQAVREADRANGTQREAGFYSDVENRFRQGVGDSDAMRELRLANLLQTGDETAAVQNLSADDVANLLADDWQDVSDAGLQALNAWQIGAIPEEFVGFIDVAACTPWQISQLTAEQVGNVPPEQMEALGGDHLGALTVEHVQTLDAQQIGAIPAAHITYLDVASLKEEQIPWLADEQVAALSIGQLRDLRDTCLQTELTGSQLAAIPAKRIWYLDVVNLREEQVPWLTDEQVATFSVKQFKDLRDSGLQTELTESQLTAIPANRIRHLNVAGLKKEQIPWLTGEQVAALSFKQLKDLSDAGLQTELTVSQLPAIPANRIRHLNVAGLKKKQIPCLTDEQVAALSIKQLKALSDAGLQTELTESQLPAIPAKRIRYLDVAGLEQEQTGLTPEQIPWLTPEQVANITANQFAKFTAEQLRAFTLEQVEVIEPHKKAKLASKPNEMAILDLDYVRNLSAGKIAKLRVEKWDAAVATHQVEAFGGDTVDTKVAFGTAQLQTFTGDQIRAIPLKRIKYVNLAAFKPEQFRDFSLKQVLKFTPYQLARLDRRQLGAFRSAQKRVLKSLQTVLLDTDQLAALDGYKAPSGMRKAVAKARARGASDFVIAGTATGTLATVWNVLPDDVKVVLNAGIILRGISLIAKETFPTLTPPHRHLGRALRGLDFLTFAPNMANGLLNPSVVSVSFQLGNWGYAAKSHREARTGQRALGWVDYWALPLFLFGSVKYTWDSTLGSGGGQDLSGISPDLLNFVPDALNAVPGAADTIAGVMFTVGAAYLGYQAFRPPQKENPITPRIVDGVLFGGGMILFGAMGISKSLDDKAEEEEERETELPPSEEPEEPTRPEEPTPPEEPEEAEEPRPQLVVTAEDSLILREAPTADSDLIAAFRPGALIRETGERKTDAAGNEWVAVKGYGWDGKEHQGWVRDSYVEPHDKGAQNETGRYNPELENEGYIWVDVESPGQSIGSIAREHSADVAETVMLNMEHIVDPNTIFTGDRIYLPAPG